MVWERSDRQTSRVEPANGYGAVKMASVILVAVPHSRDLVGPRLKLIFSQHFEQNRQEKKTTMKDQNLGRQAILVES